MLSRLKNVASNIWDYAKAVYLTNTAIVQIVGGAGGALYVMPKVAAHFTGAEIFPYQTIATSVIVGGTVMTLVYCRSEHIFNNTSKPHPEGEIKTLKGKAVLHAATGIAVLNSLSSALGFYLYASTFVEQIVGAAQHRPQNEALHKEIHDLTTVQILAASFYISKVITNLNFTVKRVRHNVTSVVKHFENGYGINDIDKRSFVIAISGATIGLIPLPMSSYYYPSKTLTKLPYIMLSESTNHIISGIIAPLSICVYSWTGPFSLYHFAKKEKRQPSPSSTCISVNSAIAHTAITVDWIQASMNNYIGIVGSSEKILGIEEHNIYLRIAAGVSSAAASGLNAMFNREGFFQSAERVSDWLCNTEQYTSVPQRPEDHPGSTPSSPQIEFLDGDATAPIDIETAVVSTNTNSLFSPPSTPNNRAEITSSWKPNQSMSSSS